MCTDRSVNLYQSGRLVRDGLQQTSWRVYRDWIDDLLYTRHWALHCIVYTALYTHTHTHTHTHIHIELNMHTCAYVKFKEFSLKFTEVQYNIGMHCYDWVVICEVNCIEKIGSQPSVSRALCNSISKEVIYYITLYITLLLYSLVRQAQSTRGLRVSGRGSKLDLQSLCDSHWKTSWC